MVRFPAPAFQAGGPSSPTPLYRRGEGGHSSWFLSRSGPERSVRRKTPSYLPLLQGEDLFLLELEAA